MPEAVSTSTWHRLRHTPLRDLLRLRVSGRLDWRRVIQDASVADEIKGVVRDVVLRTRLWRSEKASVARELIAHFADAVGAGVPVDRVIDRFGDHKQAARLIRRAKIRNRSYVWHALRFIRRAMAAMLLFYLGATVYYLSGKPTVSVDYLAKLNEPVLATPESDRAWPIYRHALAIYLKDPMPDARLPSEDGWPNTVAWLERNQLPLQAIREAAARPSLGVVLRRDEDPQDAEALGDPGSTKVGRTPIDESLLGLTMPQLNQLRAFASALAADASRGAQLRDAARVEGDFQALFQMSEQLQKREALLEGLTGTGTRVLGLFVLQRILDQQPDVLTDDALVRLAHRLSRERTAADLISLKGERYAFRDMVQRTYTDDGAGGGRLTPQGAQFLKDYENRRRFGWQNAMSPQSGIGAWYETSTDYVAGPATMMLSASRKDLLEQFDAYMDLVDTRLRQNLRDAPDDPEQLPKVGHGAFDSVRYAPIASFNRDLRLMQILAERVLGVQEGTQIAIALETYRRKHGAYPEELQLLVPTYLPSIPADRIDGRPLRYRLTANKPVIYSVGVDRDDDNGRAPVRNGKPDPFLAGYWSPERMVDGDWVRFPLNYD